VGEPLRGVVRPRLFTPSLTKLTPRTSTGFGKIKAAAAMGVEFMPWQRFAIVHGGELTPDGRPRFRVVLVLVSRQNGKTTIGEVVALDALTAAPRQLVLGTSTNLETARESWQKAVDRAEDHLLDMWPVVRRGALDTSLTLSNRSRYKVAAASRKGGRGLSVDVGLADELREHLTWEAWDAMSGATTARRVSQIWAFSNQGDDRSVVLNHLRDSALAYIESGEGDDTVCLLEWSAPDDCDLDDRQAWRRANPALGFTIDEATLVSKLATHPPASFRTEYLCQRVASMDAAVDERAWKELADVGSSLEALRDRVALCLDVALDLQHVTLVAAALAADGRVRVDVVGAWGSTVDARADLPELIERVKPRVLGWFPGGPAAALAADLRGVRRAEEIKAGDVPAVCQGLAEQVAARRVLHTGDPLLIAQIGGVSKLYSGDGWRFTRKGVGHCDAVYALAGAVHLARLLPPKVRPMVLVGKRPAA
jgi:hypothetical protein